MSDEIDTDGDDDSAGIKSLRGELNKLKARNKELEEFQTSVAKANRESALTQALTAKGLNPKLANLYNGDDTSEDAVSKWAQEFGFAPSDQTPGEQAPPDPNAEAARRVNAASYGTEGPANVGEANVADAIERKRLYDTQTYEECVRLGILPQANIFGPAR